ncbi:hypothetical protein DXM27_03860 [Rhizobium rhizogenes]|uniref:Uncharacterized protein n=1 Tax=Rhizobium rhizogenes TaxID=359 RepID=A0AA88JRJ9_RHIRH|nr:hypothetical protein [Rhizobium rhizogenes]KAA3504381.1 hypothetical protein DXM27_03860 [Rhizobium rhizogenes]
MAVYLVTYDLNKETKRPDILKDIRDGDSWAMLSESSYAIETNETPRQVYDRLKKHLDGNDNLLVVTMKNPYYGQATKDVIDWLDRKLQ